MRSGHCDKIVDKSHWLVRRMPVVEAAPLVASVEAGAAHHRLHIHQSRLLHCTRFLPVKR
jgi:hypothetical protein